MRIKPCSTSIQSFYANFKRNVIILNENNIFKLKNADKFIGEIKADSFWISKESILPQRVPNVRFSGKINDNDDFIIDGHFKIGKTSTIIVSLFAAFIFLVILATTTSSHPFITAIIFSACFVVVPFLFIFLLNLKKMHDILKFIKKL